MKEEKGRYVFPGNLKIPVGIIQNLPEKERSIILDVLNGLRNRLISYVKYNEDACYAISLSFQRTLFIDYKDNRLNFFIDDKKNNEYTQILTLTDCLNLARKESIITERLKDYASIETLTREKRENNLTQTLIHSAYEAKKHNRGSPTVFKKHINNDFDLDR